MNEVAEDSKMPAAEEKNDGLEKRPPTNMQSGPVSISLAASGIAAAFAAQATNGVVRVLAAVAFVLATVSAFELYWVYMVSLVPGLVSGTSDAGRGTLHALASLARRWLKLLASSVTGGELASPEHTVALGLLNLLFALLLIVAVVSASVALSFLR